MKFILLLLLLISSGFIFSDAFAQSTFSAFLDGDCIKYENPPSDAESVWLWGPQQGNEAYYYDGGQWYGGANIPGGSQCGGLIPGDYKFAVFSGALDENSPDEAKIVAWSNTVNVEPIITSFSADKSSYSIGETITISGHIEHHNTTEDAIYHINAPNGPSILQNSTTIDSNGDFTAQIFLDDSTFTLEGTYDIIVIHVAGSITASTSFELQLPEPIIHPSSPCDDGCTHEGNNPDLKIFASGYVENPIDGVNTISSVWKDPDGIVVYDSALQVNAQGQFNNEFDNPMFVSDMRDSGLYTTTYQYDDVVLEYSWNYLSSVYEAHDTIPPVVVTPNDMAIQATSNNPSPVTFSVTATDDTDGSLSPACSHNSGDNFPIGVTTVTCTATDAAGNTDSESFTITVTYDESTSEPTSGISFTNPAVYNAFGTVISSINEGQQVQFSADLENFSGNQNFVYMVQIEDSDGTPINLAWISGQLSVQSFNPALSWIPKSSGTFVVNLYVFDSITNLKLLASPLSMSITINDSIQEISENFNPSSSSSNHLTVSLSDDSLSTGDILEISGKVPNIDEEVIGVTVSIKDPSNNLVYVSADEVSNSNYDFVLKTDGLIKDFGEYEVKVHYGSEHSSEYFDFSVTGNDSEPTPDSDFRLIFDLSDMSVLNVKEDHDFNSLIFTVDVSASSGILEVTFPRDNFDSLFNGVDDDFVILVDGDKPTFSETKTTSQSRTLQIELPSGAEEIEIIGSKLIGQVNNNFPIYSNDYEDISEIVSLSTKKSQYRTGDTIVITGKVSTSNFNIPVTLQVIHDGDFVDISQITISTDETFSHTILAEGPQWLQSGKYTIKATFGSYTEDYSFIFRVSDVSIPEPDDEINSEITITPVSGSSSPGCEDTVDGCYIPSTVSVTVGGKVIMKNTDTAAHTFTAGTPDGGPSGEFDTGLLMAGNSFEYTADTAGEIPYFCMVHPWMIGTILVGEGTIPSTPEPQPKDHVDLEIEIENHVYDINTVANLNISISGTNEPQNVAIDVTDPRGTSVISRSVSVDPEQGISFEFKIDENFKQGNYKITATTSDGSSTVTDTAHFKVKSQFNSFKITSVQVTDQKGNPSNLQPGEIGFIKVTLESSKSIATLMTVNIFDSELTSIGIGSVNTTLSSGNSEIILSFMIPEDVALGQANIYVNAFSDWPSSGGVPLTGEVSIVEDIQ